MCYVALLLRNLVKLVFAIAPWKVLTKEIRVNIAFVVVVVAYFMQIGWVFT